MEDKKNAMGQFIEASLEYEMNLMEVFIDREDIIFQKIGPVMAESYTLIGQLKILDNMGALKVVIKEFSDTFDELLSYTKKLVTDLQKEMDPRLNRIKSEFNRKVMKIKLGFIEKQRRDKHRLLLNNRVIKLNRAAWARISGEIGLIKDLYDCEFKICLDRLGSKHEKERSVLEVRREELDIVVKQRIKRIFSYKDMIKLAEENGFVHARTAGDHMIFKNMEGFRIVVIPAHELGYGLMCKIQKDILGGN